jgi:hypothetical protein
MKVPTCSKHSCLKSFNNKKEINLIESAKQAGAIKSLLG